MGAFIRSLLIVLLLCGVAFAEPQIQPPEKPKTLDEIVQSILDGTYEEAANLNTWNREKNDKGNWEFRTLLENASKHPIWLQIWDGTEIIWSKVIPAQTSEVVWMEATRARRHLMYQWKPVGGGYHHWFYKGWTLDEKAAYVADILLKPLTVEEADVQRYYQEAP